ncbi:DinB family protein [Stackebrandtia nassauensis]|uniref:DinB family protein n=1 Tax=Stackebrandtia nassauensis TaxID=283811 RepID=UPI0002E9AB5E
MINPDTDVPPPRGFTEEKATLVACLNYLRDRVVAKLSGLSDEQASDPGVPSGTSPMGLVKHLTSAELNWFVWAYTAEAEEQWEHSPLPDELDSVDSVIAEYRAANERCDAIIEACTDLGAPGKQIVWEGEPSPCLRWILVHTIEDTARHAGHLDILRERIDGSIGR